MTERLYYDDAYLTEFDATVTACAACADRYKVYLDRSAFYPTSGGQPYDTGTIGDANVLDVIVDDKGDVCHVTDRPLTVGACVHGRIDWARRFDHMQQHAGDHLIASALWRLLGGVTIGLHESSEVSTIDVAMPDGATHIGPDEIRRIELDVNERIQRDVPVRCWFPEPDELVRLPLRKKPTVSEHVRVVAIGDDEMVACGGTHPSSAGQIGLVKITGVAPARGKMRVSFLAGMRAYRDYQVMHDLAHETASMMSTSVMNLPEHVVSLQEALKRAEYELSKLRLASTLAAIEQKMDSMPVRTDGTRVLTHILEGDIAVMREAASQLIRRPGLAVLLGVPTGEDSAAFVFARSADVDIHMGKLMAQAARPLGGKGGGRPDFAQGGGSIGILDAARDILLGQ
ncbi:MAG: hypothetical protein IJJ45_04240 [Clostridia bacterium]|nr:hypothetical protein [Clostridia bacterium]